VNEKRKSMLAILWLVLAAVLAFLGRGDTPIELAVWLSPVFLLRYFSNTRPLWGFLTALPCMALAVFFSSQGMTPFPLAMVIVLTIISTAVGLLPYLLHRLLAPKLPAGIKTLLFPAGFVTIMFLFFLGGSSGTWGNQAYGVQDLILLQLVSVTGIWGITFLIYWTAAVINQVWWSRDKIEENRSLLISFVVVLIVVCGYGVLRLHYMKPIEKTVRIAGITPTQTQRVAVGSMLFKNPIRETDIQKMRPLMDQLFLDLVEQSVKVAKSGVEMVVWSEGAAIIFAGDEERYLQRARSAAKEQGIYLGLAVIVLMDNIADLKRQSKPFFKNKFIFILPDGTTAWEHMKAMLVPGLEAPFTIPGDGILKTMDVPIGRVTGAICYEMDFPQLIRQAGKSGSSLLLAPSNDWAAIKHTHAAMARFRAIENGLALFRPTRRGISTAVDPYGRIVSQVDYFQSKGTPPVAVLPVQSVPTLYSFIGDLFAWLVLLGTLFLLVFAIIRHKRRKGEENKGKTL